MNNFPNTLDNSDIIDDANVIPHLHLMLLTNFPGRFNNFVFDFRFFSVTNDNIHIEDSKTLEVSFKKKIEPHMLEAPIQLIKKKKIELIDTAISNVSDLAENIGQELLSFFNMATYNLTSYVKSCNDKKNEEILEESISDDYVILNKFEDNFKEFIQLFMNNLSI